MNAELPAGADSPHGGPDDDAKTKTCTIDGCDRPLLARGWCQAHYARWWKTRDPRPAEPIAQYVKRPPRRGRPSWYTGSSLFRAIYDADDRLIGVIVDRHVHAALLVDAVNARLAEPARDRPLGDDHHPADDYQAEAR
jgi:hypothetical protein